MKQKNNEVWFFNYDRLKIFRGVISEVRTSAKINVYRIKYTNDFGLKDKYETIEEFIAGTYPEIKQKAIDAIRDKIYFEYQELTKLENKLEELYYKED